LYTLNSRINNFVFVDSGYTLVPTSSTFVAKRFERTQPNSKRTSTETTRKTELSYKMSI